MTTPKKKKLLILWGSYDYNDIYQTSFVNHPDFEIELVSAEGLPAQHASYRRLLQLRKRVDAGEFDLVVANNVNRSPFPGNKGWATTASLAARLLTYQLHRLDSWWAPWIVRYGKSKTSLAVVDSRDGHFVFPWDLPLLEACKLYFKKDLMYWPRRALMPVQNYYTEKRVKPHEPKLRAMSLGMDVKRIVPLPTRPMKDRDIDILISGHENSHLRRLIREKSEAMSDRYRVVVKKFIEYSEYEELIQRSKLVVCVESFGGETWRQWEVAAAGCVPIMSWPYTDIHEPLVPDEHAFYFSYIGDHFERTVHDAFSDPDRLQRIADAAQKFAREKKPRPRLLNFVVDTTLASSS